MFLTLKKVLSNFQKNFPYIEQDILIFWVKNVIITDKVI